MKFKEFMKELEKARKKNKPDFEKGKIGAKEIVENAENAIILATDGGATILGAKPDVEATLTHLFIELLENNFLTEEEIKKYLKIAKKLEKVNNDDNDELDELLNKLKEVRDLMKDLEEK